MKLYYTEDLSKRDLECYISIMHWQDMVLTIGQIIFVLVLIPAIFSKQKPSFLTSSVTSAGLFSFSIVYFSLALWFAAIATLILSVEWCILAAQVFPKKSAQKV